MFVETNRHDTSTLLQRRCINRSQSFTHVDAMKDPGRKEQTVSTRVPGLISERERSGRPMLLLQSCPLTNSRVEHGSS
eukprot:5521224-Amphidinium_carterae.1